MYFRTILESLDGFDDYDVVSHILFGFKTAYLIDNSISVKKYENEITEIMKKVISLDKTLEFNTKVHSMIPMENASFFLNLYKSLGGINLTLSSDAHSASRFMDGFEIFIPEIKKAGFDHLNYFVKRKRYDIKI